MLVLCVAHGQLTDQVVVSLCFGMRHHSRVLPGGEERITPAMDMPSAHAADRLKRFLAGFRGAMLSIKLVHACRYSYIQTRFKFLETEM